MLAATLGSQWLGQSAPGCWRLLGGLSPPNKPPECVEWCCRLLRVKCGLCSNSVIVCAFFLFIIMCMRSIELMQVVIQCHSTSDSIDWLSLLEKSTCESNLFIHLFSPLGSLRRLCSIIQDYRHAHTYTRAMFLACQARKLQMGN